MFPGKEPRILRSDRGDAVKIVRHCGFQIPCVFKELPVSPTVLDRQLPVEDREKCERVDAGESAGPAAFPAMISIRDFAFARFSDVIRMRIVNQQPTED